jgi:hypothetical protein
LDYFGPYRGAVWKRGSDRMTAIYTHPASVAFCIKHGGTEEVEAARACMSALPPESRCSAKAAFVRTCPVAADLKIKRQTISRAREKN